MFGLLLIREQKDRRKATDFLENFENVMDFYQPKNPVTDPICPFYIPNDGWITDKIDLVINKIKDKSFFKRFNKLQLVKELVISLKFFRNNSCGT